MKKIILIIILLFLTGCDYIELNDLSIIKSIAIDYEEEKYLLYAEIIDEINEENTPTTEVITVKEKSIEKCFQELIILSNKTIHYSHIDLLILSTNLENKHLMETFKYFLNTKNFRNDFMVVASNNVKDLIKKSKYDEVEQLIDNNQHQELINIDIEEVIKDYLNHHTFTLSLLEYQDDNIVYQYNVKYKNNDVVKISNKEENQ